MTVCEWLIMWHPDSTALIWGSSVVLTFKCDPIHLFSKILKFSFPFGIKMMRSIHYQPVSHMFLFKYAQKKKKKKENVQFWHKLSISIKVQSNKEELSLTLPHIQILWNETHKVTKKWLCVCVCVWELQKNISASGLSEGRLNNAVHGRKKEKKINYLQSLDPFNFYLKLLIKLCWTQTQVRTAVTWLVQALAPSPLC